MSAGTEKGQIVGQLLSLGLRFKVSFRLTLLPENWFSYNIKSEMPERQLHGRLP